MPGLEGLVRFRLATAHDLCDFFNRHPCFDAIEIRDGDRIGTSGKQKQRQHAGDSDWCSHLLGPLYRSRSRIGHLLILLPRSNVSLSPGRNLVLCHTLFFGLEFSVQAEICRLKPELQPEALAVTTH